jgi:hypothetical protein
MLHTLKNTQLLHADMPTVAFYELTRQSCAYYSQSMDFEVISNEDDLQHMYPVRSLNTM